MKLRIEISDDCPDEVVIRCRTVGDEVRRLQTAFESALGEGAELVLSVGETEYFVPVASVLFFETENGRITVHTSDRMYYSDSKLYELEKTLPRSFVRISKSCIANSAKISSISHGFTGPGEVLFSGSDKKVYVSRMYYKILKETIYETRIVK